MTWTFKNSTWSKRGFWASFQKIPFLPGGVAQCLSPRSKAAVSSWITETVLRVFSFSPGFHDHSLGGGNSNIFLCSPRNLGKMNPFWRAYFSNGLVQPPTSSECHSVCHLPGVVIQISKVAPKSSWNFRRTRPIRTFLSKRRCCLKSHDFLKGIHLRMKENCWVAKNFKHAWIAFNWSLDFWLLRHFCRFGVGFTVVVFLDVFNFSPLEYGKWFQVNLYVCFKMDCSNSYR